MQPATGVDYPLQLGASLLGKRSAQAAGAEEYCTLRYDFKPASAGRAVQGQMEVQLASQKVALQMGDSAFTGKYEPSKDGLDYVAVFDGATFRLELLGAAVKSLRHVSGAGRNAARSAGPPAAQPVAAAAAAADAVAAAVAQQGAAGAGDMQLEMGHSVLLKDDLEDALLRGLADGKEEEEQQEEQQQQQEQEEQHRQQPDREEDAGASSSGEEEQEEEEEEEEEEEAQLGASAGAHAQQAQQQHAQQQQAPRPAHPAPLLPRAATLQPVHMNEAELLFFCGDDASPPPPAASLGEDDDSSGSSSGEEEDEKGHGSEPEQEEI